MKFAFCCVGFMALCMIAAELTAGEMNPIQKPGPVQKCCPATQKCCPVQKSEAAIPVKFRMTLHSRIRLRRAARCNYQCVPRQINVSVPGVNVCIGGVCPVR